MRSRDPTRGREIMAEVASRAVDRALAGTLPEALATSIVKHNVAERVAAEMLDAADAGELELEETERLARRIVASPAFQRMLLDALESQLTPELAERLLKHPETERIVESIVSSPAVRAALARQTMSFAAEITTSVRRGAVDLDEGIERAVHRRQAVSHAGRPAYAGIATRAAAFGVDLALSGAIYLVATAMLGLVAWLAGGLERGWLLGGLAATTWTLFAGGYFVLFWTVAGQTPGMRLMGLRVLARSGTPRMGRSIVRFLGLLLALAPLFAGFLPVLFDARRRGLHDFLAGTVVVNDDARES